MKSCVYTVITGDYCDPLDPGLIPDGWDRICLSDNTSLESPHWRMVQIDERKEGRTRLEDAKLAKRGKTRYWEWLHGYDTLLYLDARITVVRPLDGYLDYLRDRDFVFMRHNSCPSILAHFDVLLEHGYENPETIKRMKDHYASAGYSYDNGLIGGGVLLFRDNDRTRRFMADWYSQIERFSHRDQASANFALFLNPGLSHVVVDNPIYTKPRYFFISGKRKHPRLKVCDV